MIQLPSVFKNIISSDAKLEMALRHSFDAFEPWLEQSGMPFFPGFTDHSPRHISDVLNTAASLISDASRDLLSASDVAALCLATLLHDCGMHLTQDGFRALIGREDPPLVSGLGDRPWSQLWKDFQAEASRFGQEKLIAIFGDAEPINMAALNLENLSERDCLLIGEFIRRHHPRLAHEISIRGVPRRQGPQLHLIGFDDEILDIAGLIARSHGCAIRDTFEYIQRKYGLLGESRRIKIPFLMAVLRIADYVQVQSERAIESLLSVKELRSPISRQEWRNHFAVKDVSSRHEDPEAVYVHALPTEVRTYIKLAALFKDIQRELDQSWAVIGEVYGRLGPLSSLGIIWRRIRSNIDDRAAFGSSVPYIPIKASFDASGSDLLKLLVGPLYDYRYEIAIREMVQNAVDACKEHRDLHPVVNNGGDIPDVVVTIQEADDGSGWVTVKDMGVGMTLDTVTRYFLVAGASFRNSDVWKRQHMDDAGMSRVLRGGRFGVGALAAFLLGDQIKVRTRHMDRHESEGLEFDARMDDPIIELKKCVADVGTSITVFVSDPKVFAALRPILPYDETEIDDDGGVVLENWHAVDWYAHDRPVVQYCWSGFYPQHTYRSRPASKRRVSASFSSTLGAKVPTPEHPDGEWNILRSPDPYSAILWEKAVSSNSSTRSSVVVNGIRVRNHNGYYWDGYGNRRLAMPVDWFGDGPDFEIIRPALSIFDPMGLCPINLQRSEVSFDLMGKDLIIAEEIVEEFFEASKSALTSCESFEDFYTLCQNAATHPYLRFEGLLLPFMYTIEGVYPLCPDVMYDRGVQNIYFLKAPAFHPLKIDGLLQKGDAIVLCRTSAGEAAALSWFRAVLAPGDQYVFSAKFPFVLREAAALLAPTSLWALANSKGKVRRGLLEGLVHKSVRKTSCAIVRGDQAKTDELLSVIQRISKALNHKAEIGAWAISAMPSAIGKSSSGFSKVWRKIMGRS